MNELSRINRRRFLQGTAIALSIPPFESLACGSGATSRTPRRLVCVGNHLGFYPDNFFPKDAGRDYTATSTLKPLEAHRDDLTVFSHLDHGLNGGHKGVQGFLNSIKKEEAAGFPEKNISLDHVAAEHVGSSTRFASINTGIERGTDMCWTRAGIHVPPINNSATLFRGLFVNSPQSQQDRTSQRHDSTETLNPLHTSPPGKTFRRKRASIKVVYRAAHLEDFRPPYPRREARSRGQRGPSDGSRVLPEPFPRFTHSGTARAQDTLSFAHVGAIYNVDIRASIAARTGSGSSAQS